MAWADPQDVLSRWVGDNPPTDAYLVAGWIADAETLIRHEVPLVDERIADGTLPWERVRFVVVSAVLRVLRNPGGIRSRQEATGPFTTGVTYSGDDPGSLHLTDQERGMLGGGTRGRRAFTINTVPGAWQ